MNIFWLLPILMLTLIPQVWLRRFNIKQREKGNHERWNNMLKQERNIFVVEQVARFLFGILFVLFFTQIVLIDVSVSAFFSCSVAIITILLIKDIAMFDEDVNSMLIPKVIAVGLSVSFVVLFLWSLIPIGQADKLYNIVDGKDNNDPVEKTINVDNILTVPYEAAVNKGNKAAGKIPNPTSYTLGDFSIQKIDDELFYVAPIEYASIIKALNVDSVPGYIKVSAENIQANPEVVTGYKMKYIPSAVFGKDLMRTVRNEFPNDILLEASFEPDENGKPYYAVSYASLVRYRSGEKVEGVILVDAETGKMKKYSINEVPSFVDEVIPSDTAYKYNKYYGHYEKGWLNSWTSQQGVHSPTTWDSSQEVVGVFGQDKEMYWFTDHTTANTGDKSMVGYTLMNARTGELVYYTHSNGFLNGSSAMTAVDDTFKAEQWKGVMPVIYNIYGTETWVVPVLDSNDMYRELAIVHAETGKLVHDENKQIAFQKYKELLATLGKGEIDPTDVKSSKTIEGVVKRVQVVSTNNSTAVKVMLNDSQNVYNINEKVSPYALFIKEGDTVKFEYYDTDEITVNIIKFESDFTH